MSQSYGAPLSRVPLSASLEATLQRAYILARQHGHRRVTLEHLLIALLDDPDAGRLLEMCAVPVPDLGRLVAHHVGHMADRFLPGEAGEPGLDGDLVRILDYASAAAQQSRRREINGAIVLSAIVGEGKSTAAAMLHGFGVTFDAAIQALQRHVQPQRTQRPAAASADLPAPVPLRHGSPEIGRAPPPPPPPAPTLPPPVSPAEQILASARERVQAARAAAAGQHAARGAPVPQPTPEPAAIDRTHPPTAPPRPVEVVAAHVPPPPEPVPMAPPPPEAWPPSPSVAPPPPPPPAPPPPPRPVPQATPTPVAPPAATPMATEAAPAPVQAPAQAPIQPRPLPSVPQPPPMAVPVPAALPPAADSRAWTPQQPPPPRETTHPPRLPPAPMPPRPPVAIAPLPLPPAASEGPRSQPPAWTADAHARPAEAMPAPPQPASYAPVEPRPVPVPVAAPAAPAASPAAARSAPGRQGQAAATSRGLLVENVPRRMTVGVAEAIEVRIARSAIQGLGHGLEGRGAVIQHDLVVTRAMSVRIRAPDGGFFIESASPDTQWIETRLGLTSDEYASWRWTVTPRAAGGRRLQIIVAARTVGADGLAAESLLPEQTVEIRVRTNYRRAAAMIGGWALAAVVGGILGKFGESALGVIMGSTRLLGGG